MTFKVETTEIAEAEIEALFLRLNIWNPDIAGRWLEGLLRAIEGLDIFPRSHPVVRQSEQLNREVRRMSYKHGRTTYLILFCLIDANEIGDSDIVHVLHVRHGAQGSVTEI